MIPTARASFRRTTELGRGYDMVYTPRYGAILARHRSEVSFTQPCPTLAMFSHLSTDQRRSTVVCEQVSI
jgi:hypothetical protein